jgi:hypothetical protein
MTFIPAEPLEGLKGGWCVPLLEVHRVYLFVPDCDGQRFADLFRKTWNRLSGHATKRILLHWRADSPFATPLLRPQIELVDGWSGRWCDMSGTALHGNQMVFHKPSVDRMPDVLVETLIARELVGVFDTAIRGYDYREDPLEKDLRHFDFLNLWGFDNDALEVWWLTTYRDEIINSHPTH